MKLLGARRRVFAVFSVLAVAISVYSVLTIIKNTYFNTNAVDGVGGAISDSGLIMNTAVALPDSADAIVGSLDSATENKVANANMTVDFLDSNNNVVEYATLGSASSANTTLKLKVKNNADKTMHISGITIENEDLSSVSSLSLTGWEGGVNLNKSGTAGDSNIVALDLTTVDGKYTTNIDEMKKIVIEYYFDDTLDGNDDNSYNFTQIEYIGVVGRIADSLSKNWLEARFPYDVDKKKHTHIVFKVTEENPNNIGTNDFYITPSSNSSDTSTMRDDGSYYAGELNYATDLYVNTSKFSDFSQLPIKWKITYPYAPDDNTVGHTYVADDDGDSTKRYNDIFIVSYSAAPKWYLTVDGNISVNVDGVENTGDFYGATANGITAYTDLYDKHSTNDAVSHGVGIPDQGGGKAYMTLSGTIPSSAGTTDGYVPITVNIPVIGTDTGRNGNGILRSTATVHMTMRVHTYTDTDVANAASIIKQPVPVADYIDDQYVDEYKNAIIEAKKVLSDHQRSAESLNNFVSGGSARLVAAQNALNNNLFSAKNVLMQKDVRKSGDLNSTDAATNIRYRIYKEGDSYELSYWDNYKNIKDKYNNVATGTINGNLSVEYDYWDISLGGYEAELVLDNEAVVDDRYTDESRQALQDKMDEIGGVINNLSYNEPASQSYIDGLVDELVAAREALIPKVKVTFENYDGAQLSIIYVVPGGIPVYDGDEPIKTPTVDKVYAFNGWSPKNSGPAYGETVDADIVYVAQFNDGTPRPYVITFYNQNEDGGEWTELCHQTVYYGNTWDSCVTTNPEKASTAQYHFTYKGWDITGDISVKSPLVALEGSSINTEYRAIYDPVLRSYEVKFYDGDGVSVLQSGNIFYGTTPVYNGATPTKERDAQYTYEWDGTWNPEISPVRGEISYYPNFNEILNKYKIEFRNYNGDLLQVLDGDSKVEYGTVPVYSGEEPTKPATEQYIYEFDKWDPEIVAVTGEAVYTAMFKEFEREYTVTFKNNGNVIHTEVVKYGETPLYNEEPEMESTPMYDYTFQHWNPSIDAPVTGETVYVAEYARTKRSYVIEFVDYDNNYLYSTIALYGSNIEYPYDNPTREGGLGYYYEFTGWSPSVGVVTGQKRYVAQYDKVYINYTVAFYDDNGDEITKKEDYHYGDVIVAPADPTKAADHTYTYEFTGWNPTFTEGTTVTDNAEYTATYDATYIDYVITFVDYDDMLISEKTYHYGDTVVEPMTPTREATPSLKFIFDGWDTEVTDVSDNKIYKATYVAVPYEITFEWLKNQTYTIGIDDESILHIDVALKYFEHIVEVDGVEINEYIDYIATDGSTVITLKKEFLDTLALGEHTLTVYYDDCVIVSTTFNIDENTHIPDTGFLSRVSNFVINNIYQSFAIVFVITTVIFGTRKRKEQR